MATVVFPLLGFIVNAMAIPVATHRGDRSAALLHALAVIVAATWPVVVYKLIDPTITFH